MAYAMEFREAVARAYDECGSSIEVAEQFNCSESWVRRRATQSATALFYLSMILVFLGELAGQYLLRSEGLAM